MPEMKPQVYLDDRPAEYFDQFHESARKGAGWTYTLARIVVTLPTIAALPGHRPTAARTCRSAAPRSSRPTTSARPTTSSSASTCWRKVRFMAKSQLFGPPVLTYILKVGGVFPVRRGHRDDKAFETAYELIDQGELLLVYAEGGRSRSRRARHAETGDRPDRAGERRADHPDRDLRLGRRPRLEAAALPAGDRRVRRAADLPGRSGPEPGAPAGGRRPRSSPACARCTRGSLLEAGSEPGSRTPDRAQA